MGLDKFPGKGGGAGTIPEGADDVRWWPNVELGVTCNPFVTLLTKIKNAYVLLVINNYNLIYIKY